MHEPASSACPLCAARLHTSGCPRCGLLLAKDGIWRSPRSGQETISYPSDGNDRCARVEPGYWFQHRNRIITRTVARHPAPGRIWDVGGGNGVVAVALRAAGHEVGLIEPGPPGCARARARGISPVICTGLADLSCPPGVLPAVGLFDVLEHLADDHAALEWMRELLVPGGRLYLTVPCHPWLWSAADAVAGHHRRYSLDELRRLVTRAGFHVRYASCFFAPLVPPILLWRRALARDTRGPRPHQPPRAVELPLRGLLRLELAALRIAPLRVGSSAILVAERCGSDG